jgi:hypothetical protein
MSNRDINTNTDAKRTIPSGEQAPLTQAEDRPNSKGEIFALLRSVSVIISAVLVVGWLIG